MSVELLVHLQVVSLQTDRSPKPSSRGEPSKRWAIQLPRGVARVQGLCILRPEGMVQAPDSLGREDWSHHNATQVQSCETKPAFV